MEIQTPAFPLGQTVITLSALRQLNEPPPGNSLRRHLQTLKQEKLTMTIYETVTNRIINQLAAGQVPWHHTWKAGLPKSLTTGKEYRGVNLLVLGSTGYRSRYWLTYREAQRQGGHIRKGECAVPVIYWKWSTPEELAKPAEQTGQENLTPCVPFVSAVFNLDQVEGVSAPEDDFQHRPENRLQFAELMFDVMPDKPEIIHSLTAQPAYSPRLDRITLPHLSQFHSADEYYTTLFHELVRSTGAPRRLNRFAKTEDDRVEKNSCEELVAEFGAAFLCGFAGIRNRTTEALQASHIEGWERVFKQDRRTLVRAAAAAQRAADYIRGKVALQPTRTAANGAPTLEVCHA